MSTVNLAAGWAAGWPACGLGMISVGKGDVDIGLAQPRRFPAETISHAVWLCFQTSLSLPMLGGLLAARGIIVSHGTVRQWALSFGQGFASQTRRKMPAAGDKWHVDEVVLTIPGGRHWLWRALGQDEVVLDILVQSRRDTQAAKRSLRKLLKLPKQQCRTPPVMVSEAVAMRRDELGLDRAQLWVRRLKDGLSVEQPAAGDELRAVKRHHATRTDALPWLFISERIQPLTRQSVNHLIVAAAGRAGLPGVHPHTLRHPCGFALASRGCNLRLTQDHLGHRDPRHTVHCTRTAGRRFEGLWQ